MGMLRKQERIFLQQNSSQPTWLKILQNKTKPFYFTYLNFKIMSARQRSHIYSLVWSDVFDPDRLQRALSSKNGNEGMKFLRGELHELGYFSLRGLFCPSNATLYTGAVDNLAKGFGGTPVWHPITASCVFFSRDQQEPVSCLDLEALDEARIKELAGQPLSFLSEDLAAMLRFVDQRESYRSDPLERIMYVQPMKEARKVWYDDELLDVLTPETDFPDKFLKAIRLARRAGRHESDVLEQFGVTQLIHNQSDAISDQDYGQ
jgi:hypothetical protein